MEYNPLLACHSGYERLIEGISVFILVNSRVLVVIKQYWRH